MAEVAETSNAEEVKKPEGDEAPKVTSLSDGDIEKLIEKARKQEKDKLYGTIDGLKKQLDDITAAQVADKAEKDQIADEAKAEADKERQAKLSIEDRMKEQFKTFEERLASEAEERRKLETSLDEERKQGELERYKHHLLENAGDEIVKELVQGKSKEELETSVATAKQKYQDYFGAAVKIAEGTPGRKLQEAGAKMPNPADPDPDPADEQALRGLIPTIDPSASGAIKVSEDYTKNRDAILDGIAKAYNTNR